MESDKLLLEEYSEHLRLILNNNDEHRNVGTFAFGFGSLCLLFYKKNYGYIINLFSNGTGGFYNG